MHRVLSSILSGLTIVVVAAAVADPTFAQTAESSSSPGGLSLQLPVPSDAPRLPADATPASSAAAASSATPSTAVESSVVKVFSSKRAPDPAKPWTKQAATEVTGTGVVIEGRRILTNAHVVAFSSEVQVQANQAGDKLAASVEAIAPGIDLAVLKIEDEKFFDTHASLPRADQLPEIKNEVLVYGYPTGGTSLSITKGIVSRIEFTHYQFPVAGLRIQLDAAINAGNSGGPAVVDDKMIGVAFSHLGGADNIGYVIPCEEIDLFLHAIAGGHYAGKPGFFERWQTLENPTLRPFLKLPAGTEGVIIGHPASDDPSYPLKSWDVVTHIGETPIDDQGMVKVRANLRVHFPYLVQRIVKDGKVPLTIVRQGKEMRIELPAPTNYPLTIPDRGVDYPPYFILGPLSFGEASSEIIAALAKLPKGNEWLTFLAYSGNPLIGKFGEKESSPGERLAYVTSPFFPHKLAKGYGNPALQVVRAINGHAVKNLANLVQLLRDSSDEFLTIEFAGRRTETLVFPRKEMIAATEGILNDNGVRSQGSPELMAIWNAHPPK